MVLLFNNPSPFTGLFIIYYPCPLLTHPYTSLQLSQPVSQWYLRCEALLHNIICAIIAYCTVLCNKPHKAIARERRFHLRIQIVQFAHFFQLFGNDKHFLELVIHWVFRFLKTTVVWK